MHHIRNLIGQGEHQKLDFKFEISDSRKIARTLVAFSNTDGGTMLIGVKDNGVVAGVRSEEEKYMVETAALMYSKPFVSYSIMEWEIDGKTILEVNIPKSEHTPHYAQEQDGRWLVYIRVNDQNLLANSVLLKVWTRRKQNKGVVLKFTEPERFLLNYLHDKGVITLSEFTRKAAISRARAENILVNYILLNIIDIIITEKGVFYREKEQVLNH
jgi:predicted HTH transcriptional regulator